MKYQVIIIGGGIVGLATAYKLLKSKPGLKLLLLEKESDIAQHQTGHNSGVIHSGLYYKPGSLKAINCINGYHQLLDFCQDHQIPFEICGKIVVATDTPQLMLLDNLHQRGRENGLVGLKMLSPSQMKEHEPHVAGLKGLWVPQTGIVDYVKVSRTMAKLISELGGEIKTNCEVSDIITDRESGTKATSTPVKIASFARTRVITAKAEYRTDLVVGCAGLYSDRVAQFTEPQLDIRIIPFRGEYYKLKPEKEYLVKNLIYPVPDPNFPFLGVHFTRMINGGVEAGPNAVLAFAKEGYQKSKINLKELVNSLRWPGFQKVAFKYWDKGLGEMFRSYSKAAFTLALQKLIPEVSHQDLDPGGAGVRAQASSRNGGLLDDFYMVENSTGIYVCNAPSPAATSSLSIGDTIAKKAIDRINQANISVY